MDETLHIETTNRCTLACPACPRTIWKNVIGKPVSKRDFDYTLLHRFLDCNSGEKIKKFRLCGDYGDSIYYPMLFDFIRNFRDRSFAIHTNASYKTKDWWQNLNSILTPNDEIFIAIDGLGQKENEKYRVNSNWESIQVAIDVLTEGPATIFCDTLFFKFNEDYLNSIKDWAESKGMIWNGKKTHRYGDNSLVPSKDKVLSEEKYIPDYNSNEPIDITPRCDEAKVITCENKFFPCDWIRNPLTFYKSSLYKEKYWIDNLDISKSNLDEAMLVLNEWKQTVIDRGKKGTCDVLCKMKCRTI